MDVRIEPLPDLRVACRRVLGPYAESIRAAWRELAPWVGRTGHVTTDTLYLGLCHVAPECTPHAVVRYDAAVTVPMHVRDDGYVTVRTVRGGMYASVMHKGPYNSLAWSWSALYWEWLPGSGRTPREAPCVESYLNDPRTTPDNELLTRLYLPLAPL